MLSVVQICQSDFVRYKTRQSHDLEIAGGCNGEKAANVRRDWFFRCMDNTTGVILFGLSGMNISEAVVDGLQLQRFPLLMHLDLGRSWMNPERATELAESLYCCTELRSVSLSGDD